MEEELYKNLCKIENLLSSWEKIKGKGSAGGIDNINISSFENDLEKNIKDIQNVLITDRYIPEPYKEIKIPKDDNEFRTLGLPTIKDKIVQQTVKDIVEPIICKDFLDSSYAYRENKGPVKAINRVLHLINNEKREWVTLCDIDRYFDNIDHDHLFSMLAGKIKDEKFLTLIRLWVKMGKVDSKMIWKDTVEGIPQGSVISPLLSNFYLHTFDVFVTEKEFGYVRYADDFIILSKSEGEANHAIKDVKWFLENKLKLTINPGSKVAKVQNGFEYLGVLFTDKGVTISKEKMEKLKNKINDSINLHDDKILKKFIETTEGIDRYYARFLSQNILEELDEWAIICLKNNINNAYNNELISKKSEIKEIISGVFFFSDKFKLFKQRELKKIIAYCNKKREKSIEKIEIPKKDQIKKKKKEYQKLESDGFELIVNTPGVFIGKTKRGISVKKQGVKCYESGLLNLKNISILSRGVAISSNVVEYCSEKDIPINFFNFHGEPYAKVYSLKQVSASLGVSQLKAFENGKANYLAKAFVSGKIKNQINLLKYYSKYRKSRDEDFMEIFDEKINLMKSLSDEAKNIDEKDLEILRGKLFSIEGRGASCYWEIIEKMLNDYIEFNGRERKGAKDIVNCMLNYGYGILYSRIWEVVISTELNANISYLHKSQDNKPSLVFDFIEQFRQQVVDRPVFSIITKNEELKMENEFLDDNTRKRVAEKVLERINGMEIYKGKEMRVFQIIKEQAKDLANFLEGKSISYHPFIGKW